MEPLPAKTQATLLAADKDSSALAPADASSAVKEQLAGFAPVPEYSGYAIVAGCPSEFFHKAFLSVPPCIATRATLRPSDNVVTGRLKIGVPSSDAAWPSTDKKHGNKPRKIFCKFFYS